MISRFSELILWASSGLELSIIGKATFILAMGLMAAALVGRGRASVRHLFLIATFGMLIALPVIVLVAPALAIEVAGTSAAGPIARKTVETTPVAPAVLVGPAPAVNIARAAAPAQWQAPSLATMLRTVWFAGMVVVLFPLVVGLWRFRQIRRTGLPWHEGTKLLRSLTGPETRDVEVLLHEAVVAPITLGALRPAVIFPRDAAGWSEIDVRRALVHELEHVRRKDRLSLLAARTVCACYWFHPLVWIAWRRLSLAAERACDDSVILNSERSDYAEQLVELAQRMHQQRLPAALGMANRSDLSIRVNAVLDNRLRRGRAGLALVTTAACIAAVMVVGIGSVRAISRPIPGAVAAGQEAPASGASAEMLALYERVTRPGGGVHVGGSGGVDVVRAIDRDLFEAAADGDLQKIEELLQAGANVNAVLVGDGTPLLGAARNGHIKAVVLLLDRNADPNLTVPGDGSALIQAADNGYLEIVGLLLDRGADPNLGVRGDGNPLIMAAREGHLDVVRFLLDRGAEIDKVVPDDENALIQACESGHLPVVKLLVSRGANVNTRVFVRSRGTAEGEWRTPLNRARKGGHTDVINYLLSVGARGD